MAGKIPQNRNNTPTDSIHMFNVHLAWPQHSSVQSIGLLNVQATKETLEAAQKIARLVLLPTNA